MADESVMNITHHISASLVLGSLLVSVSPVQAGEEANGSVELIPFPPNPLNWTNAYFSSDGQLRLVHELTANNSDIYKYANGEWTLIRRELQTLIPGLRPFGVSADGSRIVLGDFSRVDVLDDITVLTMPREWTYPGVQHGHDHQIRIWGNVSGGHISSDGQTVTLTGRERDQYDMDSLAWFGDGELVNLSADLPRDGFSYEAGIPNADGSIIVFSGVTPDGDHQQDWSVVWRWEGGQLTEVPMLNPSSDTRHMVVDISSDGTQVFGNGEGPARGSLSFYELSQSGSWSGPFQGARTAWLWTEQGGTVEIIDRARFLETDIRSVDADGTTALVHARALGSRYATQHLWFGGINFIELDELFHTLNISIDAEYYGFNQISDDGTKLMGLAWIDGRYQALIVTIPDLTP